MPTSINIHKAHDARCESFSPDNDFAFTIRANEVDVTLFGLDPVIAWGLFDLLRDGRTSFHFADQNIYEIGDDPQTSAALIRRAYHETLPHPDTETV